MIHTQHRIHTFKGTSMRNDLWDICTAAILLAAVAEVVWLWSLGCVVTAIFVAAFGVLPAFGLFLGPRRGK